MRWIFGLLIAMTILFNTFVLGVFGQATIYAHENGHARACTYAGGVPTTVFSEYGFRGDTTCDFHGRNDTQTQTFVIAAGIQETSDYPIMIMFMGILFSNCIMSILVILMGFAVYELYQSSVQVRTNNR